jgi:hypothetical protein
MLLVAWGFGAMGLSGGDPVAAWALVDWAQTQSGGDLAHPAWIDAARELRRIRPWQQGYAEARRELGQIAEQRLMAMEAESAHESSE